MLTDNDHIEALRARLNNKLKQIDNERAELVEMIRVLGDAPRVLSRTPAVREQVVKATGTRTPANRNVTELVREFIDSYKEDTPLAVPEIVKYLFERGVKGKSRSLNAAVHVILKKELGKRLKREEGVGYFKPKKTTDLKPSDSVLVHSS